MATTLISDAPDQLGAIPWRCKQLRRSGLPAMSRKMMHILQYLRQAKHENFPFADLPAEVHGRTINTLVERDWILASKGLDGVRYSITGRGLKALKVYEAPTRRFDGICCRCNERPRYQAKNGKLQPYCLPCNRRIGRRQHALRGRRLREETPCSRCKTRPRHRPASGRLIAYCIECKREQRKEEKQRAKKRLLKRLRAGEFVPCIRCKEQPRHYAANSVYDYCEACYRAMQRDYRQKRKGQQ